MKPPKSWLTEYAANKHKTKSNEEQSSKRSNNGSFGGNGNGNTDNSHRYYMAKKIDMQRGQFGLVLPPDPRNFSDNENENENENEKRLEVQNNIELSTNMSKEERSRNRNRNPKLNKLRNEHISPEKECGHGMNNILSRLKKKHPRSGSKIKLLDERKKRQKSSIDKTDGVQSSQPKHTTEAEHVENNFENDVDDCENDAGTSKFPEPKSALHLKRQRKDLFFLGVTVLVNGYTDPGADTIMRTLHKHGGDLEKYETSRVTHIIAENLSTAKAKIYKKQKRPVPVVKPQWIVDCVEAGRLLPHADYLLDEVREENVCASVKSFFKAKESRECIGQDEGCDEGVLVQEANTAQETDSDNAIGWTALLNSSEEIEPITLYQMEDNGSDDEDNSVTNAASELERYASNYSQSNHPLNQENIVNLNSSASTAIHLLSELVSASAATSKTEHIHLDSSESGRGATAPGVPQTNQTSPHHDCTKISLAETNKTKSSPSKAQGFRGGTRTVGTDPNFLDSYFSSSRLSFIGSFRQRLEKSNRPQSHATRGGNAKRFVFHVDMDCFFAAIAVRNYPQFRDMPVAVGHGWRSDPNGVRGGQVPVAATDEKKKSSSELSTCNYKARKYGVTKGMFEGQARKLCPELVVLPYDFEGYEDASIKVGEILHDCVDECHGAVDQVSCDESYLEFYLDDVDSTDNEDSEPMQAGELARSIGDKLRRAIVETTECTASIGIGPNKLLAKLATNRVKDRGGNGVFIVDDWKTFLKDVKLRELPGIGHNLERKLLSHNMCCVQDVWDISEGELSNILGAGNGSKIYKYCHGEDDRPCKPAERKTIGAECNYGVRFDGPYGVDYMMMGLAKEVEKRMTNVRVLGRHITVKVKERQPGAGPPGKFNGCGKCNDHSKSSNLPGNYATRDADLVTREAMMLLTEIGVEKNEIRGIGIVISKLDSEDDNDKPSGMTTWLNSGSKSPSARTRSPQKPSPPKEGESASDTNPTKTSSEALQCEARLDHGYGNVAACSNVYRIARVDDRVDADNTSNDPEIVDSVSLNTTGRKYDSKRQAKSSTMQPQRPNTHQRKGRAASALRPRASVVKSDGQFNIECMFQLASVKSGESKLSYDGEQVSLTQLGYLPLEIQLQVANNHSASEHVVRRPPPRTLKPVRPKSAEVIEIDEQSTCSQTSGGGIMDLEDDGPSDISVLRKWMDKHSQPSPEDVELVKDFLCVCVSEKRLDDVVCFLRLIKMRSDRWKAFHYQNILGSTEKFILNYQGRTLDLTGLGL